jgi:hypothetical protein
MKEMIWNKLNEYRAKGKFSRNVDSRIFELIGETLGNDRLEKLMDNQELISSIFGSHFIAPPKYLYDFISELLQTDTYKTVLDPWISIASPAIHIKPEKLTGICVNPNDLQIINEIFDNDISIKQGDTFETLKKDKSTYDLVLSFPPFGYRMHSIQEKSVHPDFSTSLIFEASKVLAENGKIVFLVSPNFCTDSKVKELLNKNRLSVEAIFSMPSGALNPLTGISSNLIVITKKKKGLTFVSELSENKAINKSILNNYNEKQTGKAVQLGTLIDFNDFKSISTLVAEQEMEKLAKRIGFPEYNLTDISTSIKLLKGDDTEEVEHLTNSIYLPKVGNSEVVSSLSEMKIKPKNYFQIHLNENFANSIFVANYFNSQIGKKLRDTLFVGAVIPQISKTQLNNCKLYLPDLNTQSQVVEIDSKIKQFSMRLEDLKRDLWKQPKNASSISKELKTINQEEKLENWIDKLPFPISSILWRYYATTDRSKKIEHLFHFFEAFSEFLSMIMLSALVQDKEFYKNHCHRWLDNDEKFKNWYLRATFGSWNILTSKLSKFVRSYKNDKETKEHCFELFGNPNDSFLEMLSNKRLVNTLMEVANLRNKWKGHGGITSEEENAQRVVTLEKQLNEFRQIISGAFEDSTVVSPTTSSFEDGIFTFNAKVLVGARTPFNEMKICSLIPLDRKKLYMSHSGQNKPIELLPFIKFVEESEAIYFYTSVESKDVRWVSYHFDKKAEIKQPVDDSLFKALDFLKL